MHINIHNWGLPQYLDLLQKHQPFTLGKFGDGELACLFKLHGYSEVDHFGEKNIDGHRYFKALGQAFHESFVNEKEYMKMCDPKWLGPVEQFKHQPLFERYVRQFDIDPSKLRIHTHDWMYGGASRGELGPLKEELEKRNFIIVSEPRKRALNIKYVDFVEVPAVNAWMDKTRIMKEVREMADHYEDAVFGMMSGMPTLAMQDILYPDIGGKATMMSFGSIFDPYLGHPTRILHNHYEVKSI